MWLKLREAFLAKVQIEEKCLKCLLSKESVKKGSFLIWLMVLATGDLRQVTKGK